METDPILGLLGLARRAGKLACGEEQVAKLAAEGGARAIFVASDIGDVTRRKIMRHDQRIAVMELACGRDALGQAIGMAGCAVCAVSDMGMAASAAAKLAGLSEHNKQAAARVAAKKTRIDRRKGTNKKRQRANGQDSAPRA